MSSYKRTGIVAFLSGFVLCFVIVLGIIGILSLDGARGMVFSMIFPDTTSYAAGYSDNAFRGIGIGVADSDVSCMLGEPLERDQTNGCVRWRYTRSLSDSHYRVRQINFENGKVKSKTHYYLVD